MKQHNVPQIEPVDNPVDMRVLEQVKFDQKGLIPAIAQDINSHEILMMAWMNGEALLETLKTGQVTYFSRSRHALWRKGESSGQTQKLVSAHLDCDGDCLVLKVEQNGVACHTGRRTCFYNQWDSDSNSWEVRMDPEISPDLLYKKTP